MSGTPTPAPVSPSNDTQRVSLFRGFGADFWRGVKYRPARTFSILGALTLVVVTLGICLKYATPKRSPVHTNTQLLLAEALAELDAGRITSARQIAADLRLRSDIPSEDLGIAPFVLGKAMHHDALGEWHDRERKALYLLAARYFDEARRTGFPTGREAEGLYLLGKSLHDCGRYAEALPHLQLLAESHPDKAADAYRWLASCYLHDRVPDLAQASEYNRRYLEQSALPRQDRDEALLLQAQILFQLGQFEACRTVLAQLPPDSTVGGDALLLGARLRMREGEALENDLNIADENERLAAAAIRYGEAKDLVRQALERETSTAVHQGQAYYLMGLACRRLGDNIAAEGHFIRTARDRLGAGEGVAAGLEQAELQLLRGDDPAALETYSRTLRIAAERKSSTEPWVSSEQIRTRVQATIHNYLRDERFQHAAGVADALQVLFPDVRTVSLRATIYKTWADSLVRRAEKQSEVESSTLIAESRLLRRHSGKLHEQLARMRFATREYVNDLWNSAEDYLTGQDYDGAVRMYRQFLDHELGGDRPAAMVRLGDAELARNKPDEALRRVNECIEFFPKSPYVYRARLIAAEANQELGIRERAKQLLTTNLENDSLTPASREWRESLFLLGRLHFEEGVRHDAQSRLQGIDSAIPAERQAGMAELRLAKDEFAECIQRLTESIRREPESPHSIEVRYMLAQSHVQSAKLPKRELAGATIETVRGVLRRDLHRHLTDAAEAFEDLKSRLIARQEKADLTDVEQRILRNCYFARADALYDLEQYEEAIQAYASATNRYQHEPESLEAYVQIANCHRILNRFVDSRRTLDQAKLILNRIRPDADFLATTRYDRQGWTDLLDWLTTL